MLTRFPSPPLDALVELLWHHESEAITAIELALPTGTVELIVNLTRNRMRVFDRHRPEHPLEFSRTLVCGPFSECFRIGSAAGESVVGVHFRPACAYPLLGVPLELLRNRHVDLEDLWGPAARRLSDRVGEAADPATAMAVLEAVLTERLLRSRALHPAVVFATRRLDRQPTQSSIAAITDSVGYTRKHLADLFHREVGLTPKLYGRVQRFQLALRTIERSGTVRWSEVALDCGYFDQAHFNRDFRAFSGLSPGEYLARSRRHRSHVTVD